MYCCYSHYVIRVVKLHILPFKGVDNDTRESTRNIFDVCCRSKLNISRILKHVEMPPQLPFMLICCSLYVMNDLREQRFRLFVCLSVCLSIQDVSFIEVRTASIFKIRDRKLVLFNFFKSKS